MPRVLLALLASALACSTPEQPIAPPDCTAGCGLGVACEADADCLFGHCREGVCRAPAVATSTGPVTVTVPPSGAELSVATAEGVSLKLAFPAGAVREAIAVTVTPEAPGSGWLAVSLKPAGLVLEKPATVTITLPAGTTHTADASLRFVTPGDFQLVPSSGGAEISGELRSLGISGLLEGGATRTVLSIPSPASLLVALPLPLRAKVDLANLLLDALLATGRYRDAVELQATIADLLLHANEPGFAAITGRLFDRLGATSCTALAAELARLEAATPRCTAEQQFWFRPVMNWAVIAQSVDSRQATPCAALDAYLGAMGRAAEATIARINDDPGASIKCDCQWTREARWGRTQQLVCPRLRPFAGVAALPEAEFGAVADAIEIAHEDTLLSLLAGDAPAAATERESLARPFLELAQEGAWEHCRANHDQGRLGALISTVVEASASDRASLVADAHACAVDLDWQAFAANGTSAAATGTVAPAASGRPAPEAAVEVPANGRVTLGGHVAALHCPSPARVEADALFAKVVTPLASVEVARQTAGGDGNLLGSPLELDVAALYTAVSADPISTPSLDVELWRHSPGCDGLYGTADVKLAKLTLRRGGGRIAFLRGDVTRSGNGQICTINPDGTGLTVVARYVRYDDGLPIGRPALSPDGQRVVVGHHDFATGRDFLRVLPIGGGTPMDFDHGDRQHAHTNPAWSPDGTRVVYTDVAYNVPSTNLAVLEVATGGRSALTSHGEDPRVDNADWSPDGRRLVYWRMVASDNAVIELMAMDANGQNAAPLGGLHGSSAVWSPDGTRVAYVGDTAIMIAQSDGTNPRVVTPRTDGSGYVAWSPDGTKLVFDSSGPTAGSATLSIVNADGTGLMDLTHGTEDRYPSWAR